MAQLKTHLITLLVFSALFLRAQDSDTVKYYKLPLKVSIGNHNIGLPFQNVFQAPNLNISIGSELGLNRNKKHHLFLTSNFKFIINNVIGNTLILGADIGYRYTHKTGIYSETSIGIGLLDQFHPRDIFELNTINGSYEKVKDKGSFSSLIGQSIGIGYDFSKKTRYPFRLGVNHNIIIQMTYFDAENLPIMPQSTTNIALTFKFKK